ncbi:MAG: adenosylcobinamide-GDP ribazoletransferase [Nitrospinae bacterium]|nr:adenosylcobinamide-GDP ribazoletransferase [Nitrospinota bacterium]
MHRFALALQFLTILPWPQGVRHQPEDAGGSMAFYPMIGALLASLLAGCSLLGSEVFPDGVLRPALILLLILLTGGLHLDGLADVCDGFYAGATKTEVLRIMKDPHLGTMAVLGVVGGLLGKMLLLSHLPSSMLYSALLVFPVLSRGGMVWGTWMGPYARAEGGTGEIFFRTLRGHHVWFATAFLCGWVVLFAGWPGVALLALVAAGTEGFVRYSRGRIGGMTGDTLGALNELLEILTLAAYYPLGRWHMTPAPLLSTRLLW